MFQIQHFCQFYERNRQNNFFSPPFRITTSDLEDRILETYFASNALANVEKLAKCFLIFLKPAIEQKRKILSYQFFAPSYCLRKYVDTNLHTYIYTYIKN
jgi:hypothetical protein